MSIKADERGTVMHCHRCGYTTATNRSDRDRSIVTSITEYRTACKGFSTYARDIWCRTEPLAGTAVGYLRARGLALPPKDSDLRWLPTLRHPVDGFEGPALVALIRNAITCEPMSLHRTWIGPDGSKRGTPPRMLLKGHTKIGGVVMLWPSEAVTHGLAVAEGIETALAAGHVNTPVWSLIDAGNLAQFPVLDGIDALTIFADHDNAGMNAAQSVATRWRAAGREVRVFMPRTKGHDVADEAVA